MISFFRDFNFFVQEAYIGMKRSLFMTIISWATIVISLFVFGLFLLSILNIQYFSSVLTSKLEMRVYLRESISKDQIKHFRKKVLSFNQVEDVDFIHKDVAWKRFQVNYPQFSFTDILSENPLPHTFRIYLKKIEGISTLGKTLSSYSNYVDEVSYGGQWAERLDLVSHYIHLGGICLVGILLFATLLIVVNTIRLTVLSRQQEINIMQLVGATSSFVRWPFLIEGLFIGILGGAFSVGTLHLFYVFLSEHLHQRMPFLPLVQDPFFLNLVYLSVVGLGMCLGFFGAFVSVSRALKQPS